jgi:Plasmid stabilization system protein
MTYRTTRRADQDVIDIYVHGAGEFGLDQAERYHQGLVATFELLAENPRLARERSEFELPVRLHPYRAHLIVYTIRDEDILIIRVLHARRAWEHLL